MAYFVQAQPTRKYGYDNSPLVATNPASSRSHKATSDRPAQFALSYDTKEVFYYGFRYYDPVTGRWPSRDPIEEQGGIHLYGFALNNAINWVDAKGQAVVCGAIVTYAAWTVGRWAVQRVVTHVVGTILTTTTIYVATRTRTITTDEYEDDECDACTLTSSTTSAESEEVTRTEVTETEKECWVIDRRTVGAGYFCDVFCNDGTSYSVACGTADIGDPAPYPVDPEDPSPLD